MASIRYLLPVLLIFNLSALHAQDSIKIDKQKKYEISTGVIPSPFTTRSTLFFSDKKPNLADFYLHYKPTLGYFVSMGYQLKEIFHQRKVIIAPIINISLSTQQDKYDLDGYYLSTGTPFSSFIGKQNIVSWNLILNMDYSLRGHFKLTENTQLFAGIGIQASQGILSLKCTKVITNNGTDEPDRYSLSSVYGFSGFNSSLGAILILKNGHSMLLSVKTFLYRYYRYSKGILDSPPYNIALQAGKHYYPIFIGVGYSF